MFGLSNAALANQSEFPDPSYFTTTASNFDQYFAIETQAYGPAFRNSPTPGNSRNAMTRTGNQLPQSQFEPIPDMTGGDPHISILITDALAGTGEGGYFYSGNFFAQNILNCGNAPRAVSDELPMVVIGSDNYTTGPGLPQYNPPYWLSTDMPRSLSPRNAAAPAPQHGQVLHAACNRADCRSRRLVDRRRVLDACRRHRGQRNRDRHPALLVQLPCSSPSLKVFVDVVHRISTQPRHRHRSIRVLLLHGRQLRSRLPLPALRVRPFRRLDGVARHLRRLPLRDTGAVERQSDLGGGGE